jgi:hypothetical protein
MVYAILKSFSAVELFTTIKIYKRNNYTVDACRQIFRMRIRKSATLQDQPRRGIRRILDWFRPSRREIAICLVLLYYAIKFDVPDRLHVITFIDWRTGS